MADTPDRVRLKICEHLYVHRHRMRSAAGLLRSLRRKHTGTATDAWNLELDYLCENGDIERERNAVRLTAKGVDRVEEGPNHCVLLERWATGKRWFAMIRVACFLLLPLSCAWIGAGMPIPGTTGGENRASEPEHRSETKTTWESDNGNLPVDGNRATVGSEALPDDPTHREKDAEPVLQSRLQ